MSPRKLRPGWGKRRGSWRFAKPGIRKPSLEPGPVSGSDGELMSVITSLIETERRLEELTGGQVDMVADREGHTFLLQRAQDRMRDRVALKQAAILNALPAHIALLDPRGVIVSVNEAWQGFVGTSVVQRPGYAVGLDYLAICDGALGQQALEAHSVAAGIRAVLNGEQKSFAFEYACHSPAQQRWLQMTVTPLADRPEGAVVVHSNVTEQRQAKDELHKLAILTTHSAEHDFLTGLPNRMLFNDRIGQAIAMAQRYRKRVAILFLDLDGFKAINDSLGHTAGDELLRSVARRLGDCVRASDTVSRRGGDEFVVLLAEVERAEDAAICARRILAAVARPHSIEERDVFVTTSIGASVYPDDGLDAEMLIKNADTAMYQAKGSGRQCYRFFKATMNAAAIERQFIEENLRHAIERNELALHYQPKIDLRRRTIVGVEALLRWTHAERGPIEPKRFIPVAEDCGLIWPIGSWALREACKQARAWVDAKLPRLSMAVNISALQFQNEYFFASVQGTLNEMGFDASCLELELTESVLMKRAESTASVLQSLRQSGIQVVIDDFGTGYSSLTYLQRFPIDALKIDESFVRQISGTPPQHSIVRAAIGMARNLELRVVAEGVESAQELIFLEAEQCHQGQGHFFSPAVPPDQLERVLRCGIPERGIAPCVVG